MNKHIDCGTISDEYSFNFQSLPVQPVHILSRLRAAVKHVKLYCCITRLRHKNCSEKKTPFGCSLPGQYEDDQRDDYDTVHGLVFLAGVAQRPLLCRGYHQDRTMSARWTE